MNQSIKRNYICTILKLRETRLNPSVKLWPHQQTANLGLRIKRRRGITGGGGKDMYTFFYEYVGVLYNINNTLYECMHLLQRSYKISDVLYILINVSDALCK